MTTNIGRDDSDPTYRYKMPILTTKVEGRGNGIKTVIPNMVDIARALHIHPAYPTKFFGIELGAQSKYNIDTERAIVNGCHQAPDLSKILDKFIQQFILCPTCKLPELKMSVKSSSIKIECAACGFAGPVKSTHRLVSYMLKSPPSSFTADGGNKDKKEKKKKKGGDEDELDEASASVVAAAKAGGDSAASAAAEEADAEKKKEKKEKKDKKKDKEKDESSKDEKKKKKDKKKDKKDETPEERAARKEKKRLKKEKKEKERKEKKEKKDSDSESESSDEEEQEVKATKEKDVVEKKQKAEKKGADSDADSDAEANNDDVDEFGSDDDDDDDDESGGEGDWHTDTSKAAQKKRQEAEFAEMLASARNDVENIMLNAKAENKSDSPVTVLKIFLASGKGPNGRSPSEIAAELRRIALSRGLDEPQKIKILLEAILDITQPKTITEQFKKKAELLRFFTHSSSSSTGENKPSASLLLTCIEDLLGVVERKLLPYAPMILKSLYDCDVLEEDQLINWFDAPPESAWLVNKEVAAEVRAKAKPFIEWIKNAEEESDEE